MKFTTKLLLIVLLVLTSFASLADLIYRPGHPITFDGHIHMTTMNQFAQSMFDGEFPVNWANNFANFGHPLSIIAHQVPAYLGGFLILVGFSTEIAYISLLSLSVIASNFLFYKFFRKFADKPLSFTATLLSVFFPYRALNIYTRGGLPELMATMFLPILLLGVWHLKQKNYKSTSLLIFFGSLFTVLTHPMMLVIFSVPVLGYFLYELNKRTWKKDLSILSISGGLGLTSASYYLLPLLIEMKYFYQSRIEQSVGSDTFLSIKQLYDPSWFYTLTHPGPRGNYIKLGLIEFIILLIAIALVLIISFYKKNKSVKKNINIKRIKPLLFWIGISTLMIILMLPISKFIYTLPFIYQIQYPWRFLTSLQITIPLVFIFLTQSINRLNNKFFLLFMITLVLFLRVPQFYGKNYIIQPESDYYFNQANLHSTNFNTVWSGNTEDYDKKTVQAEIIEGEGEFEIIEEKNSSRKYKTNSDEQLRIVDYTFYFSGWEVYVDGKKIPFEFQDPNYRGIITYKVPAGEHHIRVVYEYSNTRLLGALTTILSVAFATGIYIYLVRSKYLKSN